MRMVLEEARKISPTGSLDQYRKHWLVLQLQCNDILPRDIMARLAATLRFASDDFVNVDDKVDGPASKLLDDIGEYLPGISLVAVVDEVQTIASLYKEAFKNDNNPPRAVLREWDSLISESRIPRVIYAGTGLTEKDIEACTFSNVARFGALKTQTYSKTDAFDSQNAQFAYMSKFLPSPLKDSPDGELLLYRAWNWLRGRYFLLLTHTSGPNISSKASFYCNLHGIPDLELVSFSPHIIGPVHLEFRGDRSFRYS
jgi:hypothetical protein